MADQWDPERNAGLQPADVVPRSNKMVHWICPRGHRYPATISNRAINESGCPVCAGFAVLTGTNDLATTHPALAAEWHPNLNGDIRPEQVISGSNNKFAWLCTNGHTYWKTIQKRKGGQGCSTCSGRRIEIGVNDLATTHPGIAAEWHPVFVEAKGRYAWMTFPSPEDKKAGLDPVRTKLDYTIQQKWILEQMVRQVAALKGNPNARLEWYIADKSVQEELQRQVELNPRLNGKVTVIHVNHP